MRFPNFTPDSDPRLNRIRNSISISRRGIQGHKSLQIHTPYIYGFGSCFIIKIKVKLSHFFFLFSNCLYFLSKLDNFTLYDGNFLNITCIYNFLIFSFTESGFGSRNQINANHETNHSVFQKSFHAL